jgi:hypothetical protein
VFGLSWAGDHLLLNSPGCFPEYVLPVAGQRLGDNKPTPLYFLKPTIFWTVWAAVVWHTLVPDECRQMSWMWQESKLLCCLSEKSQRVGGRY